MWRPFFVLLIATLFLSACSSPGAPLVPTIEPVAGAPSASAAGAAGSTPPVGNNAGTNTVVVGFGASEYERQVYEPLIDAFNRENPDIRVQFVALDEIMNTSDGQNQVYDPNAMLRRIVSTVDTAAAWSVTPESVTYGYLRDLKPLMDADATFDRADFFTIGLTAGEINAGNYLLPRTVRVRLLSYNKNLWSSRGVAAPKVDWTWNDLLQAAEQLAQKQGNTVQNYGFVDGGTEMTVLVAELASKGIDIFSTPSDQLKLDQPEFIEALDRVKVLVDSGAIYRQNHNANEPIQGDPYQQLISEQKVAIWPQEMMYRGPGAPELSFEVGIVPYPTQQVPYANGGADGYIMSSGAQHPNEAWRWLSYLSRQVVNQPMAGPDALTALPARRSTAEQSGYWTRVDAETAAAVEAALDRRAAPPPTGNDGRFFEPLNKAIQAVITGEQGTEQALREAQQSLKQMLAQASPSAMASPDTSPIIVTLPVPDVVPAGATQITFGSFGADPQLARRVAREFNQSNQGVYVQVKDVPPGPEPMTITNVAAQMDCFSWWSAPDTKEMTATLDLKPLIDADATFRLDDYPQALLAPYTKGSALHGLPQAVNFRVMSYNQTAFDAAGIEYPSIDWTLQDLVQVAEQLTTGQGDNKQYGYVSLGGQTSDLMFFITRSGASITKGSGDAAQPNFLDNNVVKAIQLYLDLLRKASPHTRIVGYSRSGFSDESYNLLSQGRAGMWFDSGFSFGPGGPMGPNQSFTTATAPLPLNGQPLGPDDMQTRGLYISAQTTNAEACWTWLKHLSNQVASFDGSFPARISLVESEAFQAKAPAGSLEVYKAYKALLERAPQQTNAPQPFYMSNIDFYWFFRAVDRAFQGGDLERELAEAQTLTEQYIACVQGGAKAYSCAMQVDPKYEGFLQDEAVPMQGQG